MTSNFKEIGNDFFKSSQYEKAIESYLKGLEQNEVSEDDQINYFKNLSMCYLKMDKYAETIKWCNKVIEKSAGDVKSLYRRSLAHTRLGEWNKAHADGKRLIMLDCKNQLYQNHIASIEAHIKIKVDESQSYVGRVNSMINVLKDEERDEKVLLQSINNLTVLTRESSNNILWSHENVKLLTKYCGMDISVTLIEAAQRCLAALICGSTTRSMELFKMHGPQYFANMIYSSNGEHCRLTGLYLEHLLAAMTQIKVYKEKKEKHENERKNNHIGEFSRPYPRYRLDACVAEVVNECLHTLIKACNSKKLSASGRDSVLEILVRFVPSSEGIDWGKNILNTEGALQKVLEVGAASHRSVDSPDKVNNISLIETSPRTKMTVAILLAQIYEDFVSDQERNKFRDVCCDFVMDLFVDEIMESKVEAANLIGLFFQGPFEVGTAILSRPGVLEGLLLLVNSSIASYQRIALDTIVLATAKKDKCMSIVAQAVPILEEIYRTGSDSMKIRALVGMCKLGVAGGRDSSIKSLADGSNLELAKSCRRYLCQTSAAADDNDMIRWATEGLAFLTLDAEVKEALVEDGDTLDRLMSITKTAGLDCLYPLCTVLVNVTNSYDKQEVMPELVELAKYAKQHIPEEHEKDGERFVAARIQALMAHGLSHSLYQVTKLAESGHNSQSASKEMVSRLYLAVVTVSGNRGAVIQAGGGKALLSLAQSNTDIGRALAAQALAKVAISIDPRVTFPGQRSLEVVRPLLQLLNVENSGLQNFEALMALTNLASLDDSHRAKIAKEKGLGPIEQYMFEEHDMLRRAATECMCNLVQLDQVKDKFLGEENDRVKLLVLYCAEVDDLDLVVAASGALAILSEDERCVARVTKVNGWVEIMQTMLACDDRRVQHRAAAVLRNMATYGGRDFCAWMAGSNMLEVLMAVSRLELVGTEAIRGCAEGALAVLEGHGLIERAV